VTRRLLLGYLGLTLFVLVALEIPLGVQNQRTERRDLEARVERDATTLAAVAEDALSGAPSQWKQVAGSAYAYARSSGGRVVIVDLRGVARVDTSGRVKGGEDLATRPEIRAALGGTVSSGTRRSDTLHQTLLYVAVPVASGHAVHGAVRITYPTSALDARVIRYWLLLAAVAGVVLAAAALVGVRLARALVRPLRGLEHVAAEVGAGDLAAHADEDAGPNEVRSLARVFNATVGSLGRLLQSQDEFVADASHELRTPLTALRLRLENGDVEGALAETVRLADLVDALLALARADAAPASNEVADAGDVVRARLEGWRPFATGRRVELATEIGGAVPVRAARVRLEQVVDNLVANAIEAAPPGSTVTVLTRIEAQTVELRVRDAGPGMGAEERARAFDRFWRARPGTTGAGLGLAIVKRLVEADGGTVELANARGGGLDAIVRLRAA
jgi:signal transduction histidine kinase